MDMLPAHRLEPAAPLNLPPRLEIRPVDDGIRTVGVVQEDGFKDALADDGGDGVALGGADAPVGGVREVGGVGGGGVGLDLVALLVVGGDDGVKFIEVDFF